MGNDFIMYVRDMRADTLKMSKGNKLKRHNHVESIRYTMSYSAKWNGIRSERSFRACIGEIMRDKIISEGEDASRLDNKNFIKLVAYGNIIELFTDYEEWRNKE